MKLTIILVVAFSLNLSAIGYSQNKLLNFSLKNKTLRESLDTLEKITSCRFFYNDALKTFDKIVNFEAKNQDIDQVLNKLLAQTDVSYRMLNNNLVVVTLKKDLLEIKVSGTVVSGTDNMSIPGVNISEKGTTNGCVTDIDGKFSIVVSKADAILQFSFVGFETLEVPVQGRSTIDVVLKEKYKELEQVVVIGYGTVKKSDLTGAISQLKTTDMENRTIVSATQALQGKTAGVQIIQTSGAPGSTATVRVRGFSSNSSSDPLYVVDGLRTSDIGSIDPNNIESIEVLKDAASAAIYGAQAGNGVVLITTRKGKKGEGQITYDFQYVTNSLTRIPKIMNAQEYINYMTEGNLISPTEISSVWDGKTNTDWTDVAFEKSIMQKHNLSMQGGNDRGVYNLSLSYLDQNGIVKGDDDVYKRITGMINADYNIKSWLKVGTNNIMESWKSKSVSENSEYGSLLASVLTMDPLTPAYYDANNLPAFMQTLKNAGKVLLQDESGRYYGVSQVYQAEQVHPLIMRDRTDATSRGANLLGTIYLDFKPVNGLVFTSKIGYRASYLSSYSFGNVYYANSVTNSEKISISRTNTNSIYYQWENFANYIYTNGKHNLTTMLGTSYSNPYSTNLTASGDAITKNDVLYRDLNYLTSTATKSVSGGYSNTGRQFSYFGRVIYNYDNKYLLQASLRRDASDMSILPSENKWGTFPSASLGYTISNESFFPKNTPITLLKLRASWGQNGSTGPLGSFAYRAAITSGGSYPFSDAIAYQVASYPSTLSNPELKWETSEQTDLGFDLRALNDRLTFSMDYFIKTTKDLLVATVPPYETGVSSTVVNAGNVSNKGIELELGWSEKRGDFSYTVRGNLATLKNKVTYLDPSISRIAGASFHTITGITAFEEGYPVWYMRGYQLKDIDDATGDPVFADQLTIDTDGDGNPDKADGVINEDDKVKIGSGIPDFTYGITVNAAYKGFDLTIFGSGSQGNDIFNCLTRIDRPRGNKLSIFYDDRWTPTNKTASKPRPNANGEDKYWISSDAIMDGSFFKLKQIQLGYTLPKQFSKKLKMSNMRVYISLDDWLVLTKYPGFDPEASAGSTTLLGIDKGSYPNSKKAVFGVNVTF